MLRLSRWFGPAGATPTARRSTLGFESLEDRTVPSAVSAYLHAPMIQHLTPSSAVATVGNSVRDPQVTQTRINAHQLTSVQNLIFFAEPTESNGVLTCSSSFTGTHTVTGPILEKFKQLGGVNGFLGYPKTDVTPSLDFVGQLSVFQNGSIYWSPATGAHEVHGAIKDKYVSAGAELSLLGYPVGDQHANPDGWSANEFQNGSVITKPGSGTHLYFSRTQMVRAVRATEQDGTLSRPEFDFLHQAANDGNVYMPADVRDLTRKLIDGDPANARYQGTAVGNLNPGSAASKVDLLEKKWFEGADHPTARNRSNAKFSYAKADGVLFATAAGGESSGLDTPPTPFASDVNQGIVGDCYFLAALAATANKHPDVVRNMFIDNGDGTYAVKFFHGTTPEYVTVDRMLPVDAKGKLVFDGSGRAATLSDSPQQRNPIWVELAEKAYAQINESGWLGDGSSGGRDGSNSYYGTTGHDGGGIDSGDANVALAQITGWAGTLQNKWTGSAQDGEAFANAAVATLKAGFTVVVDTGDTVADGKFVTKHSYVLLSAGNDTFVVRNPWGRDNNGGPATTTLTRAEFIANFVAIDAA